ncbi:hypothetical protein [Acinetobacter larvae]|uniref:Uncharacterized protein n=1 Tax=Acinetobacter larvae TaxID=1789224 RepID=A0A1B2LZ34_9GAMM|nr:hypothetical protein [Acinetobacter larvae]AOA58181.1 hypothetical protein BFG52_07330 [Acinetobacter larvae]
MKTLPANIAQPFFVWMENGGYEAQIKMDCVVMKKGRAVAKVFYGKEEQPRYVINDHCAERLDLFLRQYLKNGKGFIGELKAKAEFQTKRNMQKVRELGYLGVAA